jgi:hypothetical protein
MFDDPLGGLLFGGETPDYFRLAIGQRTSTAQPNPGLPFRATKAIGIRTSREYAPTARRFKPVSSDRPQPAVDGNTAPAKAAREGLATGRPVVFAAPACASGSRKRGYLMV